MGQSGEAEGAGRRRIRLEEDTEADWRTGVVTWPGGKLEVDSGQSNGPLLMLINKILNSAFFTF